MLAWHVYELGDIKKYWYMLPSTHQNDSSHKRLLRFVQFSSSPYLFASKRSRPKYSEPKLRWQAPKFFLKVLCLSAAYFYLYLNFFSAVRLSHFSLYSGLVKKTILSKTAQAIDFYFCNLVQRALTGCFAVNSVSLFDCGYLNMREFISNNFSCICFDICLLISIQNVML